MTEPSLLPALGRHYWRELAVLVAVGVLYLLPWLFGVAVGVWYLWAQGLGWYWWAGSLGVLALAMGLLRFGLRAPRPHQAAAVTAAGASDAEQQARAALAALAADAGANDLRDANAVQALLLRALGAVASAYAPEDPTALWRFTVPELLLMMQDVAGRLREQLLREVPVLRHLQLTWAVRLYDVAEPTRRLLSLWRLLAWVNPVGAIVAEARGALTDQVLDTLQAATRAQVAVILVEQVGAAAIDLYAGRYRYRVDERPPTAPQPLPETPPEPLTILLAGRAKAGKSSLLNALLGQMREPVGRLSAGVPGTRPYRWQTPDGQPAVLIDSPAVTGTGAAPWLTQAARCDLVLWVAAANRPDRALDQQALAALDALTAGDLTLRRIPRLVVLTHADRLDPPLEWSPPYDLEQGQGIKPRHMRAARAAAAAQLAVPEARIALVALPPDGTPWGLDGLLGRLAAALPEARHKQLERAHHGGRDWWQVVADTAVSVPRPVEALVKGVGRWLRGPRG